MVFCVCVVFRNTTATKLEKMSEKKVSQNPLNRKRININHFQNFIFGCITVKMKFQRTQELRQLLVSQINLIRCFTEICDRDLNNIHL